MFLRRVPDGGEVAHHHLHVQEVEEGHMFHQGQGDELQQAAHPHPHVQGVAGDDHAA